MIPKQDRQGVRKAMDIEQKYDLNTDFSEIEKIAANAQRAAEQANNKATNAVDLAGKASQSIEAMSEHVETLSTAVSENTDDIESLGNRVELLEQTGSEPGEDGATFTPSVDADGNLSWTNDKGLKNPATVNIKGAKGDAGYTPVKGKDYFDGEDGNDGVSCTHSWNGTTLTIASASGTSSANLKGDKGDKGDPGTGGSAATINGMTTLNIVAGDNVTLSQSGSTLTINASGGTTATAMTVAQIRAICT